MIRIQVSCVYRGQINILDSYLIFFLSPMGDGGRRGGMEGGFLRQDRATDIPATGLARWFVPVGVAQLAGWLCNLQ